MICWVRSASVALSSVGSPSASSKLLVWSDCVPPSTAATACSATRTTLLSGCSGCSVMPAVCVWNRNASDFGFFAPKRPCMILPHIRRAARNLATSSSRLLCPLKKNESCAPKRSTERPESTATCT